MALETVTYFPIFGVPLIAYLGVLVLISFLITASIPLLIRRWGIKKIPFRWHTRMAFFSIILAFIHGVLGLAAYF